MHIYVRIEPRWEFADVRHAAIGFGRELERRDDGVTIAWWKEERGERIFVDFNQNNRDRTIASAYSLRPQPGAPVSTPMTWDELAALTDPREFNLFTVPDRMADGDPWAAIDDAAHSLEPLLRLWEELPGGELNFPPDYPKMPGEPPRVQPSKKVEAHWDADGNRIEERATATSRTGRPRAARPRTGRPTSTATGRRSRARRARAAVDGAADQPRVPSGWTPLELLSHVLHMEQRWFVWGFLGEQVAEPWGDWTRRRALGARRRRPSVRWQVADDVTAEELAARLDEVGAPHPRGAAGLPARRHGRARRPRSPTTRRRWSGSASTCSPSTPGTPGTSTSWSSSGPPDRISPHDAGGAA